MNIDHYVLTNNYWELDIQSDNSKGYLYKLKSKVNDIIYTDQDYHYKILTSGKKGARYAYLFHLGAEYKAKKLATRSIRLDGKNTLIIEGQFEDTEIHITHKFKIHDKGKWLDEYISLTNSSKKKVRLGLINFGFKKTLFKQYQGWIDHLDKFHLISIPSRRFHGYGGDRRKETFTANDILYDSWVSKETEMPGYCAEGWLWGSSDGGLLICKYNPSQIEFSRFSRISTTLPGRGAADASIIFGGSSLCQGDPELATFLAPNQTYSFGITRYAVYQGDFKEGYYLYRSHLEENGHKLKKDYNPPIHWNELYNLGWVAEKTGFFVDGMEFEVYTLEQLYKEADLARDIGAESLYLDPGWNIRLGSAIWNEERFGSLKQFSSRIHEKYGLKLALHLMMNFEGENEPDEFYLKSNKNVRVVADPYIGLYCVCANKYWVKEKTRRLLELAKEGIDFFMFDFTDLSMFMVDNLGCFSKEHGHETPMRRQTHAENIFKVIQNVKRKFPNILIEAHTRGVNHQYYYQHNLPYSFDENWGFECMWNPMHDLISQRAIQLYEYNLAYSIPLYLHINENSDNDSMLQFWWYASVVRHLGIGGLKDKESTKYKALKEAMTLYKKIKAFLTRGTFYGIDKNIHLHVDENVKHGVITAYNLSSQNHKIEIQFDPIKYGLDVNSVEIYDGINHLIGKIKLIQRSKNFFQFEVEIPSLSPIIAILKK